MLEQPLRELIRAIEIAGYNERPELKDALTAAKAALVDLAYQQAKYSSNAHVQIIKYLTAETTLRGRKQTVILEPGDILKVLARKEKGLVCTLRNDLSQFKILLSYTAEKRQWQFCLPDSFWKENRK
jgi:hypothetical protein